MAAPKNISDFEFQWLIRNNMLQGGERVQVGENIYEYDSTLGRPVAIRADGTRMMGMAGTGYGPGPTDAAPTPRLLPWGGSAGGAAPTPQLLTGGADPDQLGMAGTGYGPGPFMGGGADPDQLGMPGTGYGPGPFMGGGADPDQLGMPGTGYGPGPAPVQNWRGDIPLEELHPGYGQLRQAYQEPPWSPRIWDAERLQGIEQRMTPDQLWGTIYDNNQRLRTPPVTGGGTQGGGTQGGGTQGGGTQGGGAQITTDLDQMGMAGTGYGPGPVGGEPDTQTLADEIADMESRTRQSRQYVWQREQDVGTFGRFLPDLARSVIQRRFDPASAQYVLDTAPVGLGGAGYGAYGSFQDYITRPNQAIQPYSADQWQNRIAALNIPGMGDIEEWARRDPETYDWLEGLHPGEVRNIITQSQLAGLNPMAARALEPGLQRAFSVWERQNPTRGPAQMLVDFARGAGGAETPLRRTSRAAYVNPSTGYSSSGLASPAAATWMGGYV